MCHKPVCCCHQHFHVAPLIPGPAVEIIHVESSPGETTLFQYPVEHLGLPVQVIIELFVKIALEQAQLVAQA